MRPVINRLDTKQTVKVRVPAEVFAYRDETLSGLASPRLGSQTPALIAVSVERLFLSGDRSRKPVRGGSLIVQRDSGTGSMLHRDVRDGGAGPS